jgi:hypothetical protein
VHARAMVHGAMVHARAMVHAGAAPPLLSFPRSLSLSLSLSLSFPPYPTHNGVGQLCGQGVMTTTSAGGGRASACASAIVHSCFAPVWFRDPGPRCEKLATQGRAILQLIATGIGPDVELRLRAQLLGPPLAEQQLHMLQLSGHSSAAASEPPVRRDLVMRVRVKIMGLIIREEMTEISLRFHSCAIPLSPPAPVPTGRCCVCRRFRAEAVYCRGGGAAVAAATAATPPQQQQLALRRHSGCCRHTSRSRPCCKGW